MKPFQVSAARSSKSEISSSPQHVEMTPAKELASSGVLRGNPEILALLFVSETRETLAETDAFIWHGGVLVLECVVLLPRHLDWPPAL